MTLTEIFMMFRNDFCFLESARSRLVFRNKKRYFCFCKRARRCFCGNALVDRTNSFVENRFLNNNVI